MRASTSVGTKGRHGRVVRREQQPEVGVGWGARRACVVLLGGLQGVEGAGRGGALGAARLPQPRGGVLDLRDEGARRDA
jgi:hypothetical protein